MTAPLVDRPHIVDVEWVATGGTSITGQKVAVHTCRVCGLIAINEAPPLPCRGWKP